MGMLLWRHRVKNDNPPKLTTLEHVTPKPRTKSEVDFRELDYNSLKSFAKTKGVDLGVFRKKDEILEQLEKILG